MGWEENLPFPRGQTLFGLGAGGSITPVAADVLAEYGHLLGREFTVMDPDYQGRAVTLKVVQYDGSGNLTADARCVDYSNASLTVFSDLAPGAAADIAHPLDHKYEGKVIKDGDLCYVVVKGPCECEFAAAVTALTTNLSTDTAGKLVAAQAGDPYVVGYAEDAGGTDTNATVVVGMSRGVE
jgi:hypothetical protein